MPLATLNKFKPQIRFVIWLFISMKLLYGIILNISIFDWFMLGVLVGICLIDLIDEKV
jgi:uncharacterized protein involved in cysteine biosynthesis